MARVLIATGGTGGHIYPAVFVAEELRRRGVDVFFVGALGSAEAVLRQRGFLFEIVPARGFVAKKVTDKFLSVGMMVRGVLRSARVIGRFRPDVVIGFGGYSSFPAVLAGLLHFVPTIIHEQNVVPGSANRLLAGFVSKVCVGFRAGLEYFPRAKTVWTGTPVRSFDTSLSRADAVRRFNLDPAQKVVLVFGGSQGSRRINECFFEMYSSLPPEKSFQVILSCGQTEYSFYQKKYHDLGKPSCVRPFIANIDEAYAACDCAVTRAGAGTVTELGVLGVPAVLVPFPGAGHHQWMNACVLERRQATAIIEEKFLSSAILGDKIFKVLALTHSSQILQNSVIDEFYPDPGQKLADEILSCARAGQAVPE
jgi:UDP-N-acetylglucosamine--N-acetylmuramyl-(pentapeptide) pyrophosphoryl-undecaprenol N-acetylglucosamine transferase